MFANPGRFPVYVVVVDSEIIGFGNGGPCRSDALGVEMEVYAIYLLECAKHQGIGSELLRTIVKDFIADGKGTAGLWVMRDNMVGRRFYEKFGAVSVAEKIEHRPGYDLPEIGYAWADLKQSFR